MRRLTISVAAVLVLLALIAWWGVLSPFPNEQYAISLYATHKQEFVALAKMAESHCGWQLTPEVRAAASRIEPRIGVFCNYGTVRFILGARGLMTIGPEQIIGLTYIPGDPAREGTVVPVIGAHAQEVGNVYLRQVDSRWYVFTQNTD